MMTVENKASDSPPGRSTTTVHSPAAETRGGCKQEEGKRKTRNTKKERESVWMERERDRFTVQKMWETNEIRRGRGRESLGESKQGCIHS